MSRRPQVRLKHSSNGQLGELRIGKVICFNGKLTLDLYLMLNAAHTHTHTHTHTHIYIYIYIYIIVCKGIVFR